MRLFVAALIGVLSVVTWSPVDPLAAAPAAVRWLALGDSSASGEGIGRADAGPDPAHQCERANGDNTGAKAWAVVAAEVLAATDDPEYSYERPYFVACSGATTDGASVQLAEMVAHVQPEALQRWNVISFSFGGNNIKFDDVLKGCIDLNSVWGFFDLSPGCDVTEEQLRQRIDMLVGHRDIGTTPSPAT